MRIAIKSIVSYKGHSVKANGNVDITFSSMYDQLTESIKVLQLLNNDIKLVAKLPGQKPVQLGSFGLKSINFNGDGESTLKFVSLTDYVEMDNISGIVSQENFQLKLESDVEIEGEKE